MTNTLSTSKFVASLIGVAMVISFAFALPAKAATADDLQAQIQSLLSTIASLQAQLAGMSGGGTTGGTTGASCGVTFTSSHKQGDQGGQVMDIQKFLNNDSATMVATTGAGSTGNETSYFGPATKAAVSKFQAKYASEILAPVGLTVATGYWGPSSMAKANAINTGSCSAGTGTTGTTGSTGTTMTSGGIFVSAAAQPGNSLAVENAANVPFTRFTLTAGTNATTFDSVTVELSGLANKSAFSSVALLDENGNQLGLTKTLNSNDQASIGETTVIPAGTSVTYTVVGNMRDDLFSYSGQVASLSVVAVNTDSTVSGTLPITGAQHTTNNSLTIGVATASIGVEDPRASATKEVGTTDYTFQAVKITAGSAENVRVHSVRWNQSGSGSSDDLANVMLTLDGTEYAPMISGDYYTFNFGSGVVISKGLSKEMEISGDIVGGSASTIIFDIRKSTDLIVTGETYGYGITPTATAGTVNNDTSAFSDSTPWFDGAEVEISGGTVNSVSKNNTAAPSANVAVLVSDTILGAFTIDIEGESISVETVEFGLDLTLGSGSANAEDITNVTLVDADGSVLSGPEDGVVGTAPDGTVTFSTVEFPVGTTVMYVKGMLGSNFDSDDEIVVSTNPANWGTATGDDTGDTISLISSDAVGNTMTVQAGTLTVTTLSQPAARNIVAGITDFVFATAELSAKNSGEDIKVASIQVQAVSVTGTGTELDNVEIWADLDDTDSDRGDKFEARVASAEQMTGGATTNTLTIVLDDKIEITKNDDVEIAVVADLSSNASTGDKHTVSISDVTSSGLTSGETIEGIGALTVSGDGQTMTVSGTGGLTVTVDSSSPSVALLLDDTSNEQTLAVFRLEASNVEDLDIDSIMITNSPTEIADVDAVGEYVFYSGSTELGSVAGGSATAEIFFDEGTLTVPTDDHVLLTVKGIMNNIDGEQVQNADTVKVEIAAGADIQATGGDSGANIEGGAAADTTAEHTIYEAYPTFAFDNGGVGTTLGESINYLAANIVISNPGNEDVVFDSANSLQVNFEIGGALSSSTDVVFAVDTTSGETLDTVNMGALTGSTYADIVFTDSDLTVPAGGSREVQIRVNTGGLGNDGDTLQAWLSDDDDTNLEFRIYGDATDYSEGEYIFKGDIYGPSHVNPS